MGVLLRDVLITAGATRNPIDSIRYLSANSSGTTGVSLAEKLAAQGANVNLLGSPLALSIGNQNFNVREFTSTRNLEKQMQEWVETHPGGLILHAAAVGDYEAETFHGKISSGASELLLHLKPAPKILDQIRKWDPFCFLTSFKAAPPGTNIATLEAITEAQRQRTCSDLVFGNVLGALNQNVTITDAQKTHLFDTREEGLHALYLRLTESLER